MSLCHLCLGAPSVQTVAKYRISVCAQCWRQAESGWPHTYEPTLFDALGRAGLLIPDRNEQGLLPREYQPPEHFSL